MLTELELEIIALMQDGLKLVTWSHVAEAEGHQVVADYLRTAGRESIAQAGDLRAYLTSAESREEALQLEIPM